MVTFTSSTDAGSDRTVIHALIDNGELRYAASNRIMDQIINGVADKYIEESYDTILRSLDLDSIGAEIGKNIAELLRSKMEDRWK